MLPSGWEKRQTKDGRTFYANTISKTTQWDPPSNDPPAFDELPSFEESSNKIENSNSNTANIIWLKSAGLVDINFNIKIDDVDVAKGGFKKGVKEKIQLQPGPHQIKCRAKMGTTRTESFNIATFPNCDIMLNYNIKGARFHEPLVFNNSEEIVVNPNGECIVSLYKNGVYNTNEAFVSTKNKIKLANTKAELYIDSVKVATFNEGRDPIRANIKINPGNHEFVLKFCGAISSKLKKKISLPSPGKYQLLVKDKNMGRKMELVFGSMF